MAGETGGSASVLGGLISATGPDIQGGIAKIILAKGRAKQPSEAQLLSQPSAGALGVSGVISRLATGEERRTWLSYTKEQQRAAAKGLPAPFLPLSLQTLSPLRELPLEIVRRGYQTLVGGTAAPAAPTVIYAQQPGTPTQPQTQTWLDTLDAQLRRALELRQMLTYFSDLFRQWRGSGAQGGGGRTWIPPTTTTEVVQMPYLLAPTGSLPSGSFGMDFAGGLGTVARGVLTAAQIYAQLKGGGSVMPGGMMFGGPDFGNVQSSSSTVSMGPGWRNGRAVRYTAVNPYTGQCTSFRPDGAPLLFRGDLQAMKRVKKAARLARRAVGGR